MGKRGPCERPPSKGDEQALIQDGVHAFKRFDSEKLASIRQLADLCNEHDQIILKLNWDTLQDQKSNSILGFLYYVGEQLVGFLGLYQFQSSEAEVSGMVHPEYRRQGIFGQLVRAAQGECLRRKTGRFIFICERRSESGREYAKSIGANYSFSEYWMQLGEKKDEDPSNSLPSALKLELRQADPSDIELLTRLNMGGFDVTEADAREFAQSSFRSESDKTYIAELLQEGGEPLPIGKIHVQLDENKAFIFGFCILAAHRKQGFGRWILRHMVHTVKSQNEAAEVALEVAVENENALGLYTSCGFEIRNVNDYYDMVLTAEKVQST